MNGTTAEPGEKFKEKCRKKLLESLNSIENEGGRIDLLIKKLTETELQNAESKREMDQLRRENSKIAMFEKKIGSLEKQLSKSELLKAKLEQLCRELNKAQKDEKEQNQQRLKMMQNTHADTVNAFKKSFSDIQQSVEAKQEHSKRVDDVERLSVNLNQLAADYDTRLKELKQLYEDREADMNLIAKAREDEMKALRVQVDAMNKRVVEVFEENVKLKKQLLSSEEKVREAIEGEIGLKKMLDDYSTKYSKLLNSLADSNDSFDRVKKDMTRMNGNLIKVEADARKWKSKVEEANKMIISLNNERVENQETLALKDRQLAQLQELCRRLKKEQDDLSISTCKISHNSAELAQTSGELQSAVTSASDQSNAVGHVSQPPPSAIAVESSAE